MARLRVRLRGKNTQEIQLSPDRSYIAGRREDCDIVLVNEKGISREHFKVSFADDKWQLEVLSKYNDVLVNGEKIQQVTLEGQSLFYLGPYEFEYSETSSDLVPVSSAALTKTPEPLFSQAFPESSAGPVDKTFIGASQSIPFIKVVDGNGDVKELFKLEGGDTWVAGRDSSCDIAIRDQRVSRRQFEVRRQGPQFLIIDLGSVNGTLLNGNPVSSTDPILIKSGDAISVLDNHLYFELHDPDFKARMELVKANTPNPLVAVSQELVPAGGMQYPAHPPMGYGYPAGYPPGGFQHAPEGPKKFDFEKHRIKLIAGAVLLIAVAYVFSDSGDSKPKPVPGAAMKPQEMFNKLPPEKQILVKQTYLLAKNLYMQGKYELAKTEVTKIYEIIPEYEDTKDIERLANEALVIQQQKIAEEQREKDRLEQEEKIQAQVAECKTKINADITMEKMDECLSPVVQFNPDHASFADLRRQVEDLVMQKQLRDTQKAEYQGQVARLKNLFSRAESSFKDSQYLKAIKEYQTVSSSSLPDPNDLKPQARRQIAAIQQTLKQKTDQFANEADQAYKDQKLKEAILTLRKSVDVDPNNDDTKDKISRYTAELKKQMMVLYQEGVLEESYGNVEGSENKPGAKDKWKKIIDLDIPDGEYYGKAKIKLKKYGAF
ncbi:FHA domain-containing protein [Bdellovibrio sp. HCB337]|uniref:FHA domain-containing protein n=1 Tax=Bdellovibrio sp. HCB337 TaxID=3394358 RepID=UPI0039A691EF